MTPAQPRLAGGRTRPVRACGLSTGDNLLVHRVIERANEAAAFVCPMCTSTCPCLRAGCGSKIEKHKSAGWVGVTGRRDALCRTPLVKRLKDDEALASLVA